MVLEYQPNGTLLKTLKSNQKFNEPDVRVIIEQMLLALDYLERKKVVHRDLKPDNVLINSIEDNSEYEIRIADFGFAVFTPKDQLLTHKCGTPGYVAPEMFMRDDGYSYKADVFSLGALFFNLLTGRYLFSGENMEQTLRRNVRCDISGISKYISNMSKNCKDLLIWMLNPDPDQRPTAREAL
jgi:serine/threonine protein kinase